MIRVIELFSGVGAQRMALRNIGINHISIGVCEIDKYAHKSYEAVHGLTPNFGDITKVDKLPSADLWTYSFPCTDLSIAGHQEGMTRGSGTRSGLLWEVERLLNISEKPKYLLLENVKQLVGKKFKKDFNEWCNILEQMGYKNYWKVLNAKDFNVPQNRERVFMVSILGEDDYTFPSPKKLTKNLRDVLESNIDKKYYIKEEYTSKFKIKIPKTDKILDLRKAGDLQLEGRHQSACRVYDVDGISPTICCMSGGGTMVNILDKPFMYTIGRGAFKDRSSYNSPSITTSSWEHNTLLVESQVLRKDRNEYGKNIRKDYESGVIEEKIGNMFDLTPRTDGVSNTLTTVHKDNLLYEPSNNDAPIDYKIRRLTPLECWRLMGFSDDDFDKASKVNSNTQLYKQAGNSIVVPVLEGIFRSMFCEDKGDVEVKPITTDLF